MTAVRRAIAAILLAVPGCVATPAHAVGSDAVQFPDRGRFAVVDAAGVIPATQEKALNDRIVTWVRSSGHQLAVVTVADLGGLDIKSYGYQLGRKWGLGDAQRKDGVILLLAPSARKVRIEVGYGLEPVLTDAATSVIVRETIVPRLRAGDVPGALSAGADAIMSVVSAESGQAMTGVDHSDAHSWSAWWWTLPGVVLAAIAMLVVYRRRCAAKREAEAARTAAARRALRPRTEPVRSSSVVPAADPTVVEIEPRDGYRRWRPRDPGEQVEQTYVNDRLVNTRRSFVVPSAPPPPPAYVPPVYEAPRRRDDDTSFSSYSSSSDWESSSGDSGSSSSGYDSGGGSFGGGGSDSSY